MTGMSIQDRYNDIVKISGLSEEIVRRVFKATRQSMVKSFKQGERATLPGIVTITPELRNRINEGGTSMTSYIKLKASASPALDTELEKVGGFTLPESEEDRLKREQIGLERLNIISPDNTRYNPNSNGVLTKQINALL